MIIHQLNNNKIGSFKDGNVITEVEDFIKSFNNLDIPVRDSKCTETDVLTIFYAHGVNYNDTLTFSGQHIERPSSKDYSKGYASRGIDKWTHGFDLRTGGIYETAFFHKK